MQNFTQFSLRPALLESLRSLKLERPTQIQEMAIPVVLKGHDVLGIAQTGSGKTLSFLLPLIEKSKKTLILVPTRELAIQQGEVLRKLGVERRAILFGGVDQKNQVLSLKQNPDFIVATPGRLLDLINQKQVPLKVLNALVLDEADQMFDLGFIEDVNEIISFLPQERQTLLFSATFPDEVARFATTVLKDPRRVEVTNEAAPAPEISQKVFFCRKEDKFQLLRKLLKEERSLAIVFTTTKNSADKVREYLRHHRMASIVLHGDKSQSEREKAIELFKTGSMKILIATDIAARGVDIPDVSHVFNFELPLEPVSYVHRIGRTGRAGKKGVAISICDDSERGLLDKIQSLIALKLPSESYKGTSEPKGIWSQEGSITVKKAPTPGVSQEKRGFIDHSKRQGDKPIAKTHPGFKNRKKK